MTDVFGCVCRALATGRSTKGIVHVSFALREHAVARQCLANNVGMTQKVGSRSIGIIWDTLEDYPSRHAGHRILPMSHPGHGCDHT